MESSSPQLETFIEQLQAIDPMYWAAAGGGLILLILLVRLARKSGSKKRQAIAPNLVLSSFQIAPLGRDAFVKLVNNGESATLSAIKVIGRNDVEVKNDLAGQRLENGGTYSILLEANAKERLQSDFSLEFVFIDQQQNAYKQTFSMATQTSTALKRTKK